jgi:hypothetical protein
MPEAKCIVRQVGGDGQKETIEEVRAEETRSFDSVVARRNVGLRIVVGVVAFDLILLKIALEVSGQVLDQDGLTWAIRGIVTFAFITLSGMLIQIEHRNRDDRREYRNAIERVRAIRRGEDPAAIETPEESLRLTVRRSWATTWPLLGTLALTVAIWVMAGLLSHSRPASDFHPQPHETLTPQLQLP